MYFLNSATYVCCLVASIMTVGVLDIANAASFPSDMGNATPKCSNVIAKINQQVGADPNSCYGNGSLFFSSIQSICSDPCKAQAVQVSTDIALACSEQDQTQANAYQTYKSWSDSRLSDWACSGGDNLCFNVLHTASVKILNTMNSDSPNPEDICSPCITSWLSLINGDVSKTPILLLWCY